MTDTTDAVEREAMVERVTAILDRTDGKLSNYDTAMLIAQQIAAKPTPKAVSGEVERLLWEAVEPWKDHHGDLPEYDSPLACVFDSGVQHAVELLAKELGVTDWTPCDGTEEYDGDLGGTLMNIVRASLPTDEHGEHLWPSEVHAALSRDNGGEAIPAGMKPWHGNDRAPADWDGGPVLWFDGKTCGAHPQAAGWRNPAQGIRAYTPKPASDNIDGAGVEWQPIETAPRDGTSVLVVYTSTEANETYGKGGHTAVFQANYEDGEGWFSLDCSRLENSKWTLTHWQPLPAPPAAASPSPQGKPSLDGESGK